MADAMWYRKNVYENLNPTEQKVVDDSYDAVKDVFKENGFVAMGDDRAEELVGAIVKFMEESKL